MPKQPINPRVISGKAARYVALRDQKKEIETTMKPLGDELKALALENGHITDTGTHVLEAGEHKVQAICKTSQAVNQEALVRLLQEKDLLKRCTKRVVDQSEVEACLSEGLLDFEDLKAITKSTKSYSIKVD